MHLVGISSALEAITTVQGDMMGQHQMFLRLQRRPQKDRKSKDLVDPVSCKTRQRLTPSVARLRVVFRGSYAFTP